MQVIRSGPVAIVVLALGLGTCSIASADPGGSPVTDYVANQFSGTVSPIAVATDYPGEAIRVGSQPGGVAVTPDGKTVYVTNYGSNTVTPIVVATNSRGAAIPVGRGPTGVAFTPQASRR